MRLIDADALKAHIMEFSCDPCKKYGADRDGIRCPFCNTGNLLGEIDDAPTADVVERKHGEWVFDTEPYPLGNPYGHYGCDQCGEYVPHKTNFCPFCGADMRERREDAERT